MEGRAPQEPVIPLVLALIPAKARELRQVTSLPWGFSSAAPGRLPAIQHFGPQKKAIPELTAASRSHGTSSAEHVPPEGEREVGQCYGQGERCF